MDETPRRNHQRRAYTGETIVIPRQRRERPVQAPPQRLRTRGSRLWPRVRLALLALLAVAALAVALLYIQIHRVARQVVVADVRPNAPIASPLAGANVLIVGVDERPDHPEEGVRSDTLIVAHLGTAGRWANMLSIPRDTRVTIDGVGETKINFAYSWGYMNAEALYGPGTTPQQGGMALAAQVVEQALDLPSRGQRIDYVAQVNFDGFAHVVDALGGVTIDVPKHIVDDAYPTPDFGVQRIEFMPGVQRMDGATALIYARTRHADSDFERGARQQQVLRAIAAELQSRGPIGQALLVPRLLEGLDGAVATTMPISRIDTLLGLGWLASGLDPDTIGQVRLSPEIDPQMQEIGSDLIWSQAGLDAAVSALLTPPGEATEQARVQVLNGTSVGGLAGRISQRLEQEGFVVVPADNAPTSDVQRTVVYDLTGKPHTSRRLAGLLGAELQGGPPPEGVASSADIIVIVGADIATTGN